MVFRKKKQQPQEPAPPPPKTLLFSAAEFVKGNVSIKYLDEPYIIIESKRDSMVNLVYVMNLFAKEKDYRITDFAITYEFSHVSSVASADDSSCDEVTE